MQHNNSKQNLLLPDGAISLSCLSQTQIKYTMRWVNIWNDFLYLIMWLHFNSTLKHIKAAAAAAALIFPKLSYQPSELSDTHL